MSAVPGSRMLAALAYVAGHPGCTKSEAARGEPSLHASLYCGGVERLIRRGLVEAQYDRDRKRYRLYLTDAGRALRAGESR